MSLDVTLYSAASCPHCGGEVSTERVVYEANITHNLAPMANAAGIYTACWRPGELLSPSLSEQIAQQQRDGNYHGAGGVYDLESRLPVPHARDLIEPLRKGLADLRARPDHFKQFNASNGWGLYEDFVPWVEAYLAACESNPYARVEVSR